MSAEISGRNAIFDRDSDPISGSVPCTPRSGRAGHTGVVDSYFGLPARRDPLGDPLASEGRARYAGPDFLGDGWCPDGRVRREAREDESGGRVVLLFLSVSLMVALLLGGAVTNSGRPLHVWALIGFVLLAASLVVQVALMVRHRRRNRTIMRIDPRTR